MSSLSPPRMTSLSPSRTDDEVKIETSALSSPESLASEGCMEGHRRKLSNGSLMREGVPTGDFVANLGLYSLHPGLSSLIHATQLYSRLYTPALYPPIAHPPLLPPGPISASPPRSATPPKRMTLPVSPDGSPRPPPPSPPYNYQTGSSTPNSPFTQRKRGAESPLDDLLRPWHSTPPSEQDAPIDLRVKRRRLSNHALHSPSPPATETQNHLMGILPLVSIAATPVNLSSKA